MLLLKITTVTVVAVATGVLAAGALLVVLAPDFSANLALAAIALFV